MPHIHPAIAKGNTAVITGAARGIGRATALELAGRGMNVVLADVCDEELARVATQAREAGAPHALAHVTNVADPQAVEALKEAAFARFGAVHLLMNNAAISDGGGTFENAENWQRLLGVNLFGAINGIQTFAPMMIAGDRPGLIINTGSKQGITNPPGNAAYNVSKSAVKTLTEHLAWELRQIRGCKVDAHLLIPGWTYTSINGANVDHVPKPDGAWYPSQVVTFMLEAIAKGSFYILCPDNETSRTADEKRMAWAMGDLIEDRPALSRWHPDYADTFAAWLKQ